MTPPPTTLATALAGCQAVIFDFNGTLSNDEPVLEKIFCELAHEMLDYTLTPEHYRSAYLGQSDAEIVAAMIADAPQAPTDPTHAGALHAQLIHELDTRYLAIAAAENLITAATKSLIAQLTTPCCVVTGASRRTVLPALAQAGLADAMQFVITHEDVTHGKPNPEGFLAAAVRLGVAPEACLVFEDSRAGIAAARAAGMPVVAVQGSVPTVELEQLADVVIAELAAPPA